MCGLAGTIGRGIRLDDAGTVAATRALHHRGPDDAGVVHIDTTAESRLTLVSTRLAILDPTPAGHLPMVDPDSGAALAFNGEIYNHRELRRGLRHRAFRSTTDTETLLHLLQERGRSGLDALEGMYAFAFWDPRRRQLLLARDPAGEKPLYWTVRSGGLAFASEVHALVATGLVDVRVDRVGLATYLANGFVVAPSTILEGVHALLPGEHLLVDADGALVERRSHWALPAEQATVADDATERELAGAMERSTLACAESDVPIGVFLSSGLDSATVAAVLARRVPGLTALTVRGRGLADESGPAAALASAIGAEHVVVSMDDAGGDTWAVDAVGALDQPSFDGTNSAVVSRAAAAHGLRVAVAGVGGDELFGGYPFFAQARRLTTLARVAGAAASAPGAAAAATRVAARSVRAPWKLADAAANTALVGPEIAAYQAANALLPQRAVERLLGAVPTVAGLPDERVDHLRRDIAGRDVLGAWSALAWRLFLGERVLRDVDAVSMRVSLETRTPFTGRALLDRAFALSGGARAVDDATKPLHRRVARRFLPEGWSTSGEKRGFVVGVADWMQTATGRAWIRDTLDDRAITGAGLDGAAVSTLVEGWEAGRVPWSRPWALAVLVDRLASLGGAREPAP